MLAQAENSLALEVLDRQIKAEEIPLARMPGGTLNGGRGAREDYKDSTLSNQTK